MADDLFCGGGRIDSSSASATALTPFTPPQQNTNPGGLANYLDIDPTIMRVLWLVGFFTTGPVAVFAYLLCAMIIPREPEITLV